MTLHQDIKNQVTEAMKARDSIRLNTLRGLLAAFTNEAVAKKMKPDTQLTDEQALEVIRRSVKQRKDSIEQFRKGGREDLVTAEEAELEILQKYLPQMMGIEDIRKIAEAKKSELGITDKKDIGKLMSSVMIELKGKADGKDVKNVVDSLLSS
ncbi:MAG TPA: GatB/YqeY domain-containing protein [Candidatus Paceibacterota bacterium]